MHYLLKNVFCLSLLVINGFAVNTNAAETKPNVLLYISPNEYNYSVHLLHPYYDYWFNQGPLIEPIALSAIKAKLGDTALCTDNETADTIIRIKPSLFYNPQLRVYHSKLIATVYSGSGNVLGSYIGEAQQQGFTSVDNGTNYHLNKAYLKAMQNLMTKLQVPGNEPNSSINKLPCGIIGAQAEPKINFY